MDCPHARITEQTYYRWKAKFGGMELSEMQRIKQLEDRATGWSGQPLIRTRASSTIGVAIVRCPPDQVNDAIELLRRSAARRSTRSPIESIAMSAGGCIADRFRS